MDEVDRPLQNTPTTLRMFGAKDFEFSMKVMVNKEKNKVLFAETNCHFADILLSFLTYPLGRIIKIFKKQYEDNAPTIGSLTNLYHSLSNLQSFYFVTEGAKLALLNPISSFEDEYKILKLDVSNSLPRTGFLWDHSRCRHLCGKSTCDTFPSVSIYYKLSESSASKKCGCFIREVKLGSGAAYRDRNEGVFTTQRVSFIISDDLQILPNVTGLSQIITLLGITDVEEAEPITVTIGFSEVMSLLKGAFISPTPLSDLILNETRKMNSVMVDYEPMTWDHIDYEENPISMKIFLKVVVQESSGKLLYVEAKEDFVEFMFSFFYIPLGGAEHLLAGKTCIKAVDNLYRSMADLIDDKYFKTPDMKNRLMNPNLRHGSISNDHIFPLTEEGLPAAYTANLSFLSSPKLFPKGKGIYLDGPKTYLVKDDLTIAPYCISSILTSHKQQKIPLSDVKEVGLEIGLKEGLSILKASLTSPSPLTDALLKSKNIISSKRAKKKV